MDALPALSRNTLLFLLFLIPTWICFPVAYVKGISSRSSTAGDEPWFTGPLLTPSARVVKGGHVNLEPYLFYTVANGAYDENWKAHSIHNFYQLRPQLQFKIGLSEKVDLSGTVQSVTSWTQGKSGSSFGDLPLGFDFQLYKGSPESIITYAKFTVQEIFPTGRYQKLNPKKLGTDAGGQGAYSTAFGFTVSHLFRFGSERFLNWRTNVTAVYAFPVHVKGVNVYGGEPGTRGKVSIGPSYLLFSGIEYTLTKKWSLACDIEAAYGGRDKFHGRTNAFVGSGVSAQFSVAPAIEYNWDECCGIIVGSWFTLAGRNTPRFYSGVAAFNYFY